MSAVYAYVRVSSVDQNEDRQMMPRRGVDPLDTARYILAARSALEREIY